MVATDDLLLSSTRDLEESSINMVATDDLVEASVSGQNLMNCRIG
jgi:hypothetical protein